MQVGTKSTSRDALALSAVHDALPAHIARLDPRGVIVAVNEPWRRFARDNGMVGDIDCIGVDYIAVCERASGADAMESAAIGVGIREVLAGQRAAFESEYPCHSPAGTFRWFRLAVTPLPEVAGGGVVVMHIDVTEVKQAEIVLARYAQRLSSLREIDRAILAMESPHEIAAAAIARLRDVVPCARASLVLFDEVAGEGVIVAANGIDVEGNLPGQRLPLAEFGDIERLRRGEVHVSPDATGDAVRHVTQRLVAAGIRSGIRAPMLVGGELIGCVNLTRTTVEPFAADETEAAVEVAGQLAVAIRQARLHEEIQRQSGELERRVAERTAQLAEANEELESFTTSVSHDLRAPLRAIVGFTEALLDETEIQANPRLRRDVERILRASRRMRDLIAALLRLSGLSRQPLHPRAVDLGSLAQMIAAELDGSEPQQEIEWRIASGMLVEGDPSLLRAALQNLLENARKYSCRRAPVRIEFATATTFASPSVGDEPRVLPGQRLFVIRDNGVGFAMRHADKLFTAFQRLHAADEFEGAGIGLATVRRIVHRHGGRIWAQGQVDAGASFYFTLPVARGEGPARAEA